MAAKNMASRRCRDCGGLWLDWLGCQPGNRASMADSYLAQAGTGRVLVVFGRDYVWLVRASRQGDRRRWRLSLFGDLDFHQRM
jgi:hypothetical protein